ncbi:hypothetical protein ACFLVX_02970 [Chloroflexota bacterium]
MSENQEREVSEVQALTILIQIYMSHTSKWYSALIASAVGVIALPIIALNITITGNDPNAFDFVERSFFSLITLFLLLSSMYFVSKVNYSLALLQRIYDSIVVEATGKSLSQYLIQRKSELLSKVKAFRPYKLQKAPEKWLFASPLVHLLFAFIVGLFFFLLIWWGHENLEYGLLLFCSIHLLFLSILLKYVTIL